MPQEKATKKSLSTIECELYFLIAKFLSIGPCSEAAQTLKREIASHELLPKRLDWLGNEHPTNFDDFTRCNSHIPDQFLLKVCSRIGTILDKEFKPSVSGVQSLLGAGRQSLLRNVNSIKNNSSVFQRVINNGKLIPSPQLASSHHFPPNLALTIQSRQLTANNGRDHLLPSKFYSNYHLLRRIVGHLSSVYCILFDTAGLYIFTGADDNLIKIWSKKEGRLLSTLRGHSAEITDMDVNVDSTLLASGSCDKIIRLWCPQTTAPLAVLTGHTGMVTSLKFCPSVTGETRYLASTGNDGCVLFWQFRYSSRTFNPKPIKYVERAKSGAQMICSSFSPGGTFLVTGSADHHIRIYLLQSSSIPEKIFEIEAHLDRVDSLQFANHSYRFVSGSKDGTAKIWSYDTQHWRSITLQMSAKLDGGNEDNAHKLQVTMVGWSTDDRYVITAVNTHALKVWNSVSGKLVYILKGHEDEVFVVESHPTDDRLVLSAGHDGKVILWNLATGACIKVFNNLIEGHGTGAVFDCRFSPDGSMFASTDSHGHLSIFGMGSNEQYKKIPDQQFYHTDYRPLIRDANHHVLDEQTQQAPHLMPPPFFVDIDGNPYPPHYQRLVPGRERCNNDQLVPYIAVSAEGEAEILQPIRPHDDVDQINNVQNQNGSGDPNIDDMIELFQVQNPQFERGRQPSASNSSRARSGSSSGLSPGRAVMRRDGDVEGVRQSHGNWQSRDHQGERLAWTKRCVVKKLCGAALKHLTNCIIAKAESEWQHYKLQKKKRPLPQPDHAKADESMSNRRARRQKNNRKHNYNVRSREPESSPRVVSRAHGVTSSGRVSRPVRFVGQEFENPDNVRMSSDNSSGSTNRRTTAEGTFSSSSSSSDSLSATDSDWEEDSSRKKKQPQPSQQQQHERSGTRRQPKRGDVVDVGDHNYNASIKEEEDESISSSCEEKPKSKASKASNSSQRPTKRKKHKVTSHKPNIRSQLPGGLTELPESFKPSEWLTDIIAKKAPYQPQLGDELMYFPQGHKCYYAAVKRVQSYNINIKNQPWTKMKLREQEVVKVVAVKYEIKPPRLCCLKLAVIDSASGDLTGDTFTVKYHDMPDVIDFLVLRQYYNSAMERNWKTGDRFRSIIDDAWWIGTIESQEPFELEYPDSMFQCFNVKWDNGEKEKMSPWDMEIIDEQRTPEHLGGGVPVLSSEMTEILYHPDQHEWPPCGRDVECDRFERGLEAIMNLAIAEPFNAPVDLNAYPVYAMVVEYPIDLTSIKARVENRYYRRLKAVLFDVKYIENDASLFNQPGTPIVKKAKMVVELLIRFIEDPNCEDIMGLYQEISEMHNLKDNDSVKGDNSISDSSDSAQDTGGHYLRGRRNKIKKRESRRKLASSWKQQCISLVDNLFNCEDSTPFRYAVDHFEYPDYRDVINNPMDLTTIKELLANDSYADPSVFSRDIRLVFQNSKNYNTNKKSRIYSMTIRLSSMFEQNFKKILTDWKSAVKHEERWSLRQSHRREVLNGSQDSVSNRSRRSARRAAASLAKLNGYQSHTRMTSDESEDDDVKPARSSNLSSKLENDQSSESGSSSSSSSSSSLENSDVEQDVKDDAKVEKTKFIHQNGHSISGQLQVAIASSSSSRLSSQVDDSSGDNGDSSASSNKKLSTRKPSSPELEVNSPQTRLPKSSSKQSDDDSSDSSSESSSESSNNDEEESDSKTESKFKGSVRSKKYSSPSTKSDEDSDSQTKARVKRSARSTKYSSPSTKSDEDSDSQTKARVKRSARSTKYSSPSTKSDEDSDSQTKARVKRSAKSTKYSSPSTKSDEDSDSKTKARVKRSARSTKYSSPSTKSDEESQSESSSSEDKSKGSDSEVGGPPKFRPKRKGQVPATRMTRSRTQNGNASDHRKVSQRRKRSDSDESPSRIVRVPKKRMKTRNRGKRTVAYQEDSDFEYYGNARSDVLADHDDDDDDEDDDERTTITSVSSRGRVRKLTALGRSMILN